MNSRRAHLSVLGLVVVLMGAAFWVGYTTYASLGLDLQGGLEVVLQAKPKPGQKLTADDLAKSVEVVRDRVDRLGVSEPEIRTQGADQIAIELPGIKDPDSAVSVVGSTAQLRFYDFSKVLKGKAYRNPYGVLMAAQSRAKKNGKPDGYYLFDADHKLIDGPENTRKAALKSQKGVLPHNWSLFELPHGEILVHGDPNKIPVNVDTTGKLDRTNGIWLLLEDDPALDGGDIRTASPTTDNSGWVTSITFKSSGEKKFGKVTEKLAQDGQLAGSDQSFAIVLDDKLVTAPTIDYKRNPAGIQGPGAEITGMADQTEAKNLALVLNSGALPVKFEIISKTQVSATLGKQSLREGVLAGLAGLGVVMLYLLLFYRFLGFIADLALVVYAIYFYALIVGIPITMTLPGFAGMILTIGVAADANIIIFERIREEYRLGRTVRAAIQAGYSKGLHTIIDANVVTLITALVLFVIGSGTVRGFALLLGLGTILSLLTAVAATFAMLGLVSDVKVFNRGWIIGASRKSMRFHIPWMKYRTAMFVWTAVVIIVSFSAIGIRGLNLGIDFKSGTKIDATFTQKATIEDAGAKAGIRSVLAKLDPKYETAKIVSTTGSGASSDSKKGRSYTIEVEKLAGSANKQQQAQNKIRSALNKAFGIDGFSSQTIGASFGHQILEQAIIAVIVSMLLETIYIALRFEWKFAFPVLLALLHDLVIAMGAYAITGREFTSATVAALLTILGYSLYDTVIVFDRVRENVHVLRKSSFSRIIDKSANEVLTRSINTTLVVLMPISAIFFFGGETLKDFAWALLIGVFAGAYSSLIVASPLLCWLKEREPTWKRRMQPATTQATSATTINGTPVDTGATPAGDASSGTGVDDATTTREGAKSSPTDVPPVHGERDRRPRSRRKR